MLKCEINVLCRYGLAAIRFYTNNNNHGVMIYSDLSPTEIH